MQGIHLPEKGQVFHSALRAGGDYLGHVLFFLRAENYWRGGIMRGGKNDSGEGFTHGVAGGLVALKQTTAVLQR